MKVTVFLGPTLSVKEARRVLPASYRPPVAQGDVLRAVEAGARAIAIIDGYFENVPAVWHKEILWAMSSGVHVFGAASMGALRAAELSEFGMVGVGAIFESYRSGAIDADDEVAVAHGCFEAQYKVISEAMVNVRATLQAAVAAKVLSPDSGNAVQRIAQRVFYADRSYPLLLDRATSEGVSSDELSAFRDWLRTGKVDQKRLDALALLVHLKARLRGGLEPLRVHYTFEHTDAWEAARMAAAKPKR